MSLLDSLQRSGAVRPVDLALAHCLQRIDGGIAEPVLVAAALASYAVAQGHAAFEPESTADLVAAPLGWPAPDDWRSAWAACEWIARPSGDESTAPSMPLVLENGRLYLRRYREYERRLADALARLAAGAVPPVDAAVDALHLRLFPQRDAGDAQARAARRALEAPLMLVTGAILIFKSKSWKGPRGLHRLLSIIFLLPLTASAVTGLAHKLGSKRWLAFPKPVQGTLMSIHEGAWLGPYKPCYALLLVLGGLTLLYTGWKILPPLIKRKPAPPQP